MNSQVLPARSAVVRAAPIVSRPTTRTAAFLPVAGVLLVAAIAPFERPLAVLPWHQTLTTVEAALVFAVGLGLWTALLETRHIRWSTPVTPAVMVLFAVFFVSALVSPIDRANALRFAGRMLAAAGVCLLVLNAITTRDRARMLVRVVLAVGALVSAVAVLEAAQVRAVLSGLTAFRPGFHVVGGQLRATSTLFYPTIASMYLEVAFALGLWLLLERRDRSSPWHRAFAFMALVLVGAGITATFTRAGLIGMAAVLVLVGGLRYLKSRRFDRGHVLVATLGLLLTAIVLLSRSPEALLARVHAQGSQDWYGALYTVPSTLRLTTGTSNRIPITVQNTGRVVWDSSADPMFTMSYHWIRQGSEEVVQFEGRRTPFVTPVEPGGRVTLAVDVLAPGEPGDYVLVWDVVHEYRAWLSTEGVAPGRSLARVEGDRLSEDRSAMVRLPAAPIRPTRIKLWKTALAVARDHPLIGIGPDNFRQAYGRYAGLSTWDTRVHANNMYLETLAGSGVAGLLALVWVVTAFGWTVLRQWRRARPETADAAAAMVAVWLVVAGHGLVDSFLTFTTTYVTFALAAGLALSPGLAPGQATDADRV